VFPPSSLAFTSAPLSSLNKQNSGNVHCTVCQGYISCSNIMHVERVWLLYTSFGGKLMNSQKM